MVADTGFDIRSRAPMRTFLLIVTLGILLALSLSFAAYLWWDMGEVEMGIHGLIALILGATLSLALGGGLMALVFYSHKHGYDDRQNRPDD
jgi:hypothetical protein